MFWRKLLRKIFKGRRHIGITLYPTSQCDTGCAHCMDNSDCKNPVNFTKELAQKIVDEVREQKWKLSVVFTGGGEPLLTPELLKIADVFGYYERLYSFIMITSGFLTCDAYRKQQLEDLLKRKFVRKILIEQSFNLYHPSFPERLTNTARLVFNIRGKSSLVVRTCVSLENREETNLKIEQVARDLADELGAKHIPIPKEEFKEERKSFPVFLSKVEDKKADYDSEMDKFENPQWHAIKTGEGASIVMIVQSISFEQTGKGENISQNPFAPTMCDSIMRYCDDTYLIVGPDGSVYPDCSCYPTEHMRLGKIGEDSLIELVRRKDVFADRIGKAIENDARLCKWGTNEVCTLCKQIVAEKGIELK